MSIIEAKGVSIRYMTGDFKDIGLKEYVVRRLSGKYHVNEFWADKNVSFALEKGDMLGIIGSNGAGKRRCSRPFPALWCPRRATWRSTAVWLRCWNWLVVLMVS